MTAIELHPPFFKAVRIYLHERFPLVSNGSLIAAFTACAVLFAAARNPSVAFPSMPQALSGFATVLLFFLLMRFLDEFKDAGDDAKYRPYRPVPRGLISLTGIAGLAVGAVAAQLFVQWVWLPDRFFLLFAVYGYLTLMTAEFTAGTWLKKHPIVYAFSHMLIMPLIGLYAAGIAWPKGEVPNGLGGFLMLLFCAGFVIEIGRKIRAPGKEELGVDTYSAVYGPVRAARWWLACVLVSLVLAIWLLRDFTLVLPLVVLLVAGFCLCVTACIRYSRDLSDRCARHIELASGLWSLLLFASLALGAAASRFQGVLS
jgi:4-hydroxybenzoate polyprenyltransferase